MFQNLEGKGWGVKVLEDVPMGTFVFDKILTNMEMDVRNKELLSVRRENHSHSIALDADWSSKKCHILSGNLKGLIR